MNLPTILVLLAVVGMFAAIVGTAIKNKKSGKGSCACGGCSGCAMKDTCHGA